MTTKNDAKVYGMDLWSVIPSECRNFIPSLAPCLLDTTWITTSHLIFFMKVQVVDTICEINITSMDLVPLDENKIGQANFLCMLVLKFIFQILTSKHHTNKYRSKNKQCLCKQSYVYAQSNAIISSWACSPYLCASEFQLIPFHS